MGQHFILKLFLFSGGAHAAARGDVRMGQGSGWGGGARHGLKGCEWVAEPFLLSHRCWDDYTSLYWWVIKAPILLAIFVSTFPEHPSPRDGGPVWTRGIQPGVCAEPETWLPLAGELPHLPQCHQDVSAEDPVPGHQQKLQAAVYVRTSSGKGELPSPRFLGGPRAAGALPWRSTEEDHPWSLQDLLSWKTNFGLRPSSWEGFVSQGSRTIACTLSPPCLCHHSPQEADEVHAAPYPSLRGALCDLCTLPRAHRCGRPAVLRAGPRLLPGTDRGRWIGKIPVCPSCPIPRSHQGTPGWAAVFWEGTMSQDTPQTPGTKHKGCGLVSLR